MMYGFWKQEKFSKKFFCVNIKFTESVVFVSGFWYLCVLNYKIKHEND